ncbi:MAG TPA: glycosyltransferase [Beijerinckiaceae bacterium]|jgi:glycosyltransferase involved in cell wall biosynthesis|nr:glycosyltransferase [Beijerinckiaceae bacterium]
MRLVIDLTGLQSGSRFRGIGRYARGLAAGLLRTAGKHEVWLAISENPPETVEAIRADFGDLTSPHRIVTYRTLDGGPYPRSSVYWRRARELTREHFFAGLQADAILFSSLFEGFEGDVITSGGSLCGESLRAVIAHDLIPLRNPAKYLDAPEVRGWYYDKLAAFCDCDLFLTNSDSTRLEIIEDAKIDPSRAVSVMAGGDEFAVRATDLKDDGNELETRLGITKPFFVYAASFEQRKNFEGLIAAFGRFASQIGGQHQLVLVTSNEPAVTAMISSLASEAGLGGFDVIVTGQISDTDLTQLYRRCVAMVYPSLHEGFGLPILEAMHLDAAVIGSNVTSIPEIIGLEEAMFDPTSTEEIAAKMVQVVRDDQFRQRLKENAVQRRALFTWDRAALSTWRALEDALASQGFQDKPKLNRAARYQALIKALKASAKAHGQPTPDELRQIANVVAFNQQAIEALPVLRFRDEKRVWRIEGPFDSNYSLSLVNRETARALKAKGEEVFLHSSDGPGDYPPNKSFLVQNHPDMLALWQDRTEIDTRDRLVVASRNIYPPRVDDADGTYNILHSYAWEESRFPSQWVDQFNLHLDGIACVSSHVSKLLQDSGVAVPLSVVGNGVDHWERVPAARLQNLPGKSFRFLHVSSCFPRKGADVLLAAYGQAFRRSDDVTLIIKTFKNPHNDIEARLAAARAQDPEFPDVALIFEDLPDSDLKALYQHCQVLVAPSRAEGYGLPIAEAMLSGLPVIVTNWSGQADFCNEQTAWLVDYSFAQAQTHFDLSSSVWAEPDRDHLASCMREAHAASATERARKAAAGRAMLLKDHTWSAVVDRLSVAVDRWAKPRKPLHGRLGWVTTWNCKCGIATYSEYLIRWLPQKPVIFGAINDDVITPDDEDVVRAWQKYMSGASLDGLARAVDDSGVDTLVIQFNNSFFDFMELEKFVLAQKQSGRTILMVMHSTWGNPDDETKILSLLTKTLNACDRVLVHSYHDLNRLKAIGVVGNTTLLPHGIIEGPPSEFRARRPGSTFTIGSYGFCLPHKGLHALVAAYGLLARKDSSLHLHLVNAEYPVDLSHELARGLRAEMAQLGVGARARFTGDFLPDDQALAHLRACDLIVFPYENTGESASGAVRFGIASGRPVATTNLPIFDDVKPAVFQVADSAPEILAAGLRDIISQLRKGGSAVDEKERAADRWRQEHSYEALAARLTGLIEALRLERSFASAGPIDRTEAADQEMVHGASN